MTTELAKRARKSARFNVRVRDQVRERAEIAAAVLGVSISDFAEEAIDSRARSVIAENERIVLSERDFAAFVAAIENPDPPTPQLLAAVEEYRRLREEHPRSNL